MCGILGRIGGAARVDEFQRALTTLRHRGPDDVGTLHTDLVSLGTQRLSIVDLSDAGHQPMVHHASGCAIAYNGEIYNHAELRMQLEGLGHVFSGRSDTEVLLHAYVEWGEGCLERLNGMWAFAILDPRSRRIFLARDRFGVKPLYYAQAGAVVTFASEPKALIALDPRLRAVNERTLVRFLALNELHSSDHSFYRDIKLLPPAHAAMIDVDAPAVVPRRYWQLPVHTPMGACSRDAVDAIGALLDDAVRLRLRADVPVGLSLSGGIDSSAVLRAMTLAGEHDITCFTAVYPDGAGELPWATKAAAASGARLETVDAPRSEWIATLERIAWHMDAPGYSPAVYPMWRIMGAARDRGIRVMLEGQGADESFAGYPQYASVALRSQLGHASLAAILADARTSSETFGALRLAQWLLRDLVPRAHELYRARYAGRSVVRRELLPLIGVIEPPCLPDGATVSPLTRRLYDDFTRSVLPGLLHYGDAVSMGRSVESRLPFLDYRIAQWAFTAPDACKLNRGTTKVALRDYLGRRGLSEIAARRDKQGYPTPVAGWMREDNGALPREMLLSADSRVAGYCDRRAVSRLIDRHVAGSTLTSDTLYKLISTEAWCRACVGPS